MNDSVSEALQVVIGEEYCGPIDQTHQSCTTSCILEARYTNYWQTPISRPFKLYVDGKLVQQNRLRRVSDLGKPYGTPLTTADSDRLGTFVAKELPYNSRLHFELQATGPESQVRELEKQTRDLIKKTHDDLKKAYGQQWVEWNSKGTINKGIALIESCYEGFLEGAKEWTESEQGFWSWVAESLSSLWSSFTQLLGDILLALHPDNLWDTAKNIYLMASSTVNAIDDFFRNTIPDYAKKLYNGTLAFITYYNEITQFIDNFTRGNVDGVERFIEKTLPKLTDDGETAKWAQTIRHSYDKWGLFIEIIGYTDAPKLLVAAVGAITTAIPPHVWAGSGIAALSMIAIELIVTLVMSLIAGAITIVSAGSAAVVGGILLVGRLAKWTKMAGKVATFIKRLLKAFDPILQKLLELGKTALAARGHFTKRIGVSKTNGSSAGQSRNTQQRSSNGNQNENNDAKCKICAKSLGKNGHPKRTPNHGKGIVEREGVGRQTLYATKTGGYNNASLAEKMKRAQNKDTHPVHHGVTMTHHHILPVAEASKNLGSKQLLERLGYVIHDPGNLVLMPNHPYGACHLETQLHLSKHTTSERPKGATSTYKEEMKMVLRSAQKESEKGLWCQQSKQKRIENVQVFMNKKSRSILEKINRFEVQLQHDNIYFQNGEKGCGKCQGSRDHNIGKLSNPLRKNKPQSNGSEEAIKFAKLSEAWKLEAGK